MSDRPGTVLGPGVARLAPARGVYLAADNGELVVLDTVRDRYSALGSTVSTAVRWVLNPAGFPEPPYAAALLDPLVRAGLLVAASPGTVRVTLPQPPEPGGVVSYRWTPDLSWAAQSGIRASAGQVVRAVGSIGRADWVLRRGRIGAVLRWLRARYRAIPACAARPGSAVVAAALVDAHIRARMLYPRQIECLVGSASLAAHAWARGVPAGFVIGVHKYPFVAHAWVEHDGQVLNDRPEVARRLAPIVSIGGDRES